MANIHTTILDLIGNTPLIEPVRYNVKQRVLARLTLKLEYFNANQSVKDRIAKAIIEDAEEQGKLHAGDTIFELTSGNTGIGLAAVAAAKGYAFVAYTQDGTSQERFKNIAAFGGESNSMSETPELGPLFSGEKQGTQGDLLQLIDDAGKRIARERGWFYADQARNPSNPNIHYRTTGPEIWRDTDGDVDIFIAGAGTGGTISGAGRYLKEKNPDLKVIFVQPVLADAMNITGVHLGIGLGKEDVAGNFDLDVVDEGLEVSLEQAKRAVRELAKTEGILVGESSGMLLYAATKVARRPENKGRRIVVIQPDTGLRYLSTTLFAD